jgi:hypothetical protein
MRNIGPYTGHIKAVRISCYVIEDLATTSWEILPGKCTQGLPKDSRVVDVFMIGIKEIGIIFEHASFDFVRSDQDIPEMIISYERTWKELEERPVRFREFF